MIDGWRMEAKEDRGAAEAWANGQVRALPFRAARYVPLCPEQQAAFPYLTLGPDAAAIVFSGSFYSHTFLSHVALDRDEWLGMLHRFYSLAMPNTSGQSDQTPRAGLRTAKQRRAC
ncbi:hypothetical protein CSIM01_11999 [Colletotrichum simmondsii]|uniref:Uncharacterized protein n=1 Tax=Colletotrichum simmondsii TaxID=703756 RepID=A0A135T6S7_9PEZI|nr:hypothetical protein CSIM01_11999 [Colletotrichum simmondsii]